MQNRKKLSARVLSLVLALAMVGTMLPAMSITASAAPTEQFNLPTGVTYYFDLSGETGNIGTINTAVPDKTLHYVPFTYTGTVNAYSLNGRSADDNTALTDSETANANTSDPRSAIGYRSDRSLFVADYNISNYISWDTLNTANLIFGKAFDTNYKLRSLSMGSATPGTPATNEWDSILKKSGLNNPIKNWSDCFSWGQDTSKPDRGNRTMRGRSSASHWYTIAPSNGSPTCAFRPAIEVLDAGTLGVDGLKAVTLNLNGGKFNKSMDSIQIVCAGANFKAPSAAELTRPDGDTGNYSGWNTAQDGSGTSYDSGTTVPNSVTTLYAQWTMPTPMVSFDARNGAAVANADIGDAMTLPADPAWTGYTFDGWYDGVDGTDAPGGLDGKLDLTKAKALTANTTVYAKWTKDGKTVYTQSIDFSTAGTDLCGDGYAWNNTTNTLTLSGATIRGENSVGSTGSSNIELYAVKLPTGATINLAEGTESSLTGGKCSGSDARDISSCGIYVNDNGTSGNLTINGTGTLNTVGGDILNNQAGNSYGISSSDGITISSGTINATGGTVVSKITNGSDHSSSAGISADAAITINENAVVTAIGRNVTVTCTNAGNAGLAMSNGILANGEVNFSNAGTLTVIGGKASYMGSSGLPVTNKQTSFGILFDKITFISPAVISAKGETGAMLSNKSITADGATVTGAAEPSFESGGTSFLSQANPAEPVVISFGPSISVAAQTGTATYGTESGPTFAVTSSSFGGNYPAFAPSIVWTSGSAPTGVTTVFTNGNATLTVNTTAATPVGAYTFKVISPKTSPETGNYESADATLTVDKREVAITWGSATSFAYDGNSHTPTAAVGNAVNGDLLTVTVTGGQTNVGANHTATASALDGAAAGNYKLPTSAPTQVFAITAKTVTVTDGNLEVKKPFDSNTNPGTATGKLGLTGVMETDTSHVSVKVDGVGAYADSNIGKNKTATLTISLEGSAAGNYTLDTVTTYEFKKAEITKAAYVGAAASKPNSAPVTKGDKSITIQPVTPPDGENVEYAVSKINTAPTSDRDWQTGTIFDKLDPNTEYFFFARVKGNDSHAPGGVSAGTSITTDKSEYTGTQTTAPVTDSKTDASITLKAQPITGETVEYGKRTTATGEITWQDNNPVFTGLTAGTDYYFYARVKETDGHKAGPTSAGVMIKTAASMSGISGTVTDKSDAVVEGAIVKIMNGQTVIATSKTGANGKYTFADIAFGTYSLVVEKDSIKITKTIAIATGSVTVDVKLPAGSNTVVETKPETPPTAAEGLNGLFEPTKVNGNTDDTKGITTSDLNTITGGGSVTVILTAESKQVGEVQGDVEKIEVVASGQTLTLLDLQVNKVVTPNGGTAGNPVTMTELPTVIEIVVEIPENMRTAADISVYRVHGAEAAAKLPYGEANKNGDGEYAVRNGNYVHIFTRKFSTYALGYTASRVSITSEGANGVSGAGSYAIGAQVTINAGTKSGYSFNGWTVTAGTVVLANPSSASTTFIMPAEAVTVTAGWTATGGGSTTTTYRNTMNQPENGTVTVTPVSPAKGQTVTITTKPDVGYVVDTVIVKDANGKTIAVTEKSENSYTFVQPGSKASVEVTYKKAGTKTFTDVTANDWFYDAVMAATANGWFGGTSDTTFSPLAPTSRGMIATILHRMEGTPKATAASFDDVAADAYYANGIAWAAANIIVKGYGNGNYGPNDNITREQLAAILYRYAGYKGYDVSKTAALDSFADGKSVSGYAKEAMSWAVGSGLISGRGNGTLAPIATAARAEVATILVRFGALFTK